MVENSHAGTESRVALVLSGGGAMGVAHLGVMSELQRYGYSFDWLCGVSAGAIVSACFATGMSVADIWDHVQLRRVLRNTLELPLGRAGVFSGNKVYSTLKEVLGDRRFEDIPVKLTIGVTDLSTGDPLYISEGKIIDAVQGSLTVPGVFDPFYHPTLQRWVVDGGLSDNLPISTALERYQGNKIFCVDVATGIKPYHPPQGRWPFGRSRMAAQVLHQSIRILLKSQQRQADLSDPRVVVIRPPLAHFSALNLKRAEAMLELGVQAAHEILDPN